METKMSIEAYNLSDLKVRTRKLLQQFTRDDLMYLHLNLMSELYKDFLGNSNGFIDYETYLELRKDLSSFKIKKEEIIISILAYLKEFHSQDSEWIDLNMFKYSRNFLGSNEFYSAIYNVFTKDSFEDAYLLEASELKDFLLKMIVGLDRGNYEYNCVKLIIGVGILDNVKRTLLSAEDLTEIGRTVIDKVFPETEKIFMTYMLNSYATLSRRDIEELEAKITLLKGELKKSNLKSESKNQKIKELKENVRELTKKTRGLLKNDNKEQSNDFAGIEIAIKEISARLNGLEKNSGTLSSEIKSFKDNIVKTAYENQIDNYIIKISDVKKELALRSMECKELKRNLASYENNMDDKIIEYLSSNNLSLKLKTYLEELLGTGSQMESQDSLYENMSEESIDKYDVEEVEEEILKPSRRVGYITIKDGVHYINYQDGSIAEVVELSEKMFVSEYQFVVADNENKIIRTTMSKYEDNGISIKTLKFGVVETLEPLSVKVGDDYINVTNNDFNGKYRTNQVVGLNSSNQIVRAFRLVKFNADTMLKSIKSRNLEMFYVLDIFDGGFFKLRNIETGIENIYNLDKNGIEICNHAVLFTKEGKVISALAQSRFYTASSYYSEKISYGPITIQNDIVTLKKQNGEISIVRNIPTGIMLKDDLVLAIDEFNNYLYISSTSDVFIEKPIARKSTKQYKCSESDKKSIEIKGEITIVGNLYYKNSYIMTFLKEGYRVNVLHGFDTPINKIVQTAKNSDAILVNTSYCSHDNFWKIKDEIKEGLLRNVPFVFTQESGATQLLIKFNELTEKQSIAVAN